MLHSAQHDLYRRRSASQWYVRLRRLSRHVFATTSAVHPHLPMCWFSRLFGRAKGTRCHVGTAAGCSGHRRCAHAGRRHEASPPYGRCLRYNALCTCRGQWGHVRGWCPCLFISVPTKLCQEDEEEGVYEASDDEASDDEASDDEASDDEASDVEMS